MERTLDLLTQEGKGETVKQIRERLIPKPTPSETAPAWVPCWPPRSQLLVGLRHMSLSTWQSLVTKNIPSIQH